MPSALDLAEVLRIDSRDAYRDLFERLAPRNPRMANGLAERLRRGVSARAPRQRVLRWLS